MKHYIDRITAGALETMILNIRKIQDTDGTFAITVSVPVRTVSNISINSACGGMMALSTCPAHHRLTTVKLASVKKTGADYSVVLKEVL